MTAQGKLASFKEVLSCFGFYQPMPFQTIFWKGQVRVAICQGSGGGMHWEEGNRMGTSPKTLSNHLKKIL